MRKLHGKDSYLASNPYRKMNHHCAQTQDFAFPCLLPLKTYIASPDIT